MAPSAGGRPSPKDAGERHVFSGCVKRSMVRGGCCRSLIPYPPAAMSSEDRRSLRRPPSIGLTCSAPMPTVGAEQTVLIWQHLIGIELQWMVVAMAVTTERTHWFYSLNALDRRAYSEEINQRLRRTDGRPLGQLGEDLVQQRGRRGQGHRRLHELPPWRHVCVGLADWSVGSNSRKRFRHGEGRSGPPNRRGAPLPFDAWRIRRRNPSPAATTA